MRRSLFFLFLSFFLLAGCVHKTVKEAAEERLSNSEALTIHFGKNDVIKAMGAASQFGKAQQK